jgi:hypothetical protein
MARKSEEDGELVGSFELGGFVGTEDHEIVAEPMKVSVNKPLTGLATEHSQRIFGEKFEIYKKKIGSHVNPQGEMSAVKKDWKGVQKPFKAESGDFSSPSNKYSNPSSGNYPNYSEPAGKSGELSPLAVLKNMVDNHANDIRNLGNWAKFGVLLGGIGLCGFVLALGVVLK